MSRSSLEAQMVKILLARWETWVQSLDWADPLEKEMAIHFSTLAWRILWSEKPARLQSTGSQGLQSNWVTFTFSLFVSVRNRVTLGKSKKLRRWAFYHVLGSNPSLYVSSFVTFIYPNKCIESPWRRIPAMKYDTCILDKGGCG